MALLNETLSRILVCPADHGDLSEDEKASRLICGECGRRYPVRDGIPIMLIDEAEGPDDD